MSERLAYQNLLEAEISKMKNHKETVWKDWWSKTKLEVATHESIVQSYIVQLNELFYDIYTMSDQDYKNQKNEIAQRQAKAFLIYAMKAKIADSLAFLLKLPKRILYKLQDSNYNWL